MMQFDEFLKCRHATRKSAALSFYALLELKKNWPALRVSQQLPYGPIQLKPK